MSKNVLVTDENGIIYGVTWPKRAKGLVRKGRARYIGGSAVCLTSPPDKIPEDITMPDIKTTAPAAADITYILNQIEAVRLDNQHIASTVAAIKDATSDQANALSKLVHEKEETNRVILDFFRKIYEDMNQKAHAMKVLEKIASSDRDLPVGEITNLMYGLLGIEKIK